MYYQLRKKAVFIFLPISALFYVQVGALFKINDLSVQLFNTLLSVIILGTALMLGFKKELDYFFAKSRLERDVRILSDFFVPLSFLGVFYRTNETRERLQLFIEKCEKAREIEEMNKLAREAEDMWVEILAMICCYDEAFAPRHANIQHEFIVVNMYRFMM